MKTVIIYDSVFGNTGKIAHAIFMGINPEDPVQCLPVSQVKVNEISKADLLVIGSPTRGFRPTPAISDLIRDLPRKLIQNCPVAVFDTRLSLTTISSSALRFVVRTGGYAASRMARQLTSRGGLLIMEPEGFLVSGERGPLLNGELRRASKWAASAAAKIQQRHLHSEVPSNQPTSK